LGLTFIVPPSDENLDSHATLPISFQQIGKCGSDAV
jgi:hypothetical protein